MQCWQVVFVHCRGGKEVPFASGTQGALGFACFDASPRRWELPSGKLLSPHCGWLGRENLSLLLMPKALQSPTQLRAGAQTLFLGLSSAAHPQQPPVLSTSREPPLPHTVTAPVFKGELLAESDGTAVLRVWRCPTTSTHAGELSQEATQRRSALSPCCPRRAVPVMDRWSGKAGVPFLFVWSVSNILIYAAFIPFKYKSISCYISKEKKARGSQCTV